MSRCKACNEIMKQNEMFTREVTVDSKIVLVDEDLCGRCKAIILGEYEDDVDILASLDIDILSDTEDYYD